MAFISEIKSRNDPTSAADYVEITLQSGDDINDITITMYRRNGNEQNTYDVSDFVLTGTSATGQPVYQLNISVAEGSNPNAIAAAAISNDGNFEGLVAVGNGTVAPSTGIAAGATAVGTGNTTAGNSFFYDEDGNSLGAGPSTPGEAPCFLAGTPILTPEGHRPIEDIIPGDVVWTLDHGPAEVLWSGSVVQYPSQFRRVPMLRPIRFAQGAFGAQADVTVSPTHRVFLRNETAELLFGQAEVLVEAARLVNDTTIRPVAPNVPVVWHHILLEHHSILSANGLLSESLCADSRCLAMFPPAQRQEIEECQLPKQAYARPVLKHSETRILTALQKLKA